MIKSIIKEIFITILLLIVIALVLSIIFYNYRPSTKKIPTEVAEYKMPKEMEEELGNNIDTYTQNIVTTYSVDSSDLRGEKRRGDYVSGKPNPFSPIQSTNSNKNQTNNNSNSVNNSNTNSQSPTHFLNTVK